MKPKVVMVAEDDPILSLDLQEQVTSQGHVVCGPHKRVSAAMESLRTSKPQLAIVDYHLLDGVADKLMDALNVAGVPFIVVTVASKQELPASIKPISVVPKPFNMGSLSTLMNETVGGARH